MNRLSQLLQFYNDDPNDAFTIYALALEYVKGNNALALHYFKLLQNNHADYLPMYYQMGKFYEEQMLLQDAIDIYSKGIEVARFQKNNHTLNELQSALNELL